MSVPLCTDLTRSSVYIGSALLLLVFFYINHMNCYTLESFIGIRFNLGTSTDRRASCHRIDGRIPALQ